MPCARKVATWLCLRPPGILEATVDDKKTDDSDKRDHFFLELASPTPLLLCSSEHIAQS